MVHINIDPILFRWGPITIGWHGLLIAASLTIAYPVVVLKGRKQGIDHHYFGELFLWVGILGYIGARLLYVIDNQALYASKPMSVLAIHQGGTRIYGALIGGAIATIGYARWRNLSFWNLADAIAWGIPVAVIVGRVGCTINGDTWGSPTDGSWGLVYWHPNASIPGQLLGVSTFPVPTMLQVWNVGLLALLIVVGKRVHRPGFLFLACTIVYALGRFVISIWQPGEALLFGLKQTQVVSLGVISLGISLLLYRHIFGSDRGDNEAGTSPRHNVKT